MADCQSSTNNGTEATSDDIVQQLSWFVMNEVRMPAGLIVTVIDEIERLRADRDEWKAWTQRAHDEIEQLRHKLTQMRSDNRRLADLYTGLYHTTEEARRG